MLQTVTRDAPQNGLSGNLSHLAQGLSHGGEPGVLERSALDIVEAHYGNVLWHPQFLFPQGANRADRRDVIEREYRRERLVLRQQAASHLVTQIGGGYVSLQLSGQLRVNGEAKAVGRLNDGVPACLGVRTELLTFDKSDAPVSKLE